MGIRLTSRGLLVGYALWMALLVVVHYALAEQRTGTEALIELSGVAAMISGVAVNRPARRTPWLLLAAANLTGALGQVASDVYTTVTHAPLPFPSFVDVIFLAAYPLYVAGLAMFIRARSTGPDARSVIDALILVVGLITLGWIFLIVPDATAASLSWSQRIVSVAYPVGDLLVLVTLARHARPGHGPRAVHRAVRPGHGLRCRVRRGLRPRQCLGPPHRRAALAGLRGQRHRVGGRRVCTRRWSS